VGHCADGKPGDGSPAEQVALAGVDHVHVSDWPQPSPFPTKSLCSAQDLPGTVAPV
jgi:hypothetical protein